MYQYQLRMEVGQTSDKCVGENQKKNECTNRVLDIAESAARESLVEGLMRM